MSVYMIIENIEITDKEKAQEYTSKARPILESYGAKYLASSEEIIPMGGEWEPKKMVIIEFPDMKTLRECFDSNEYKSIVHLRLNSMKGKSVAVPSL